ncbi:MAG: glutamine--fructose-6-phosphate transaminase (isomerizing) [Candidatus Pacearchaeota archaeon]
MCGIIAYIGDKQALPILLNGLKRLEYRGYDSCGLAIFNNNSIKVIKTKGHVEQLEKLTNSRKQELKGNIGIAHTRWATHGVPSKLNAHPHLSCDKKIAIVHNGIIENYLVLKKFLESRNHKFLSDTDTEVIVHLIEEFCKKYEFEEAVRLALKQLEGAYGIAILANNKLIGARKGSPLVVGQADDGIFIASDPLAFLEHTKKVQYLQDNQIVIATKEDFQVKSLDNIAIEKNLEELTLTIEQLEKQGHKHFMHKEIFEQPETIRNAFRGRLLDEDIRLDGVDEILKQDPEFFKKINRIVILACGTSWHAGLYGKYIFEALTKIPTQVEEAAEFRYRDPIIQENDFIIAISQSGETADTKGAIEHVKEKAKEEKKKIRTFGIVNVVGSSIAREVDSGIYIHAGPEIGVASTKAFTGQIVCLYLLALKIAKEKNLIKSELRNYLEDLKEIPEKVSMILKKEKEIERIAKKYKKMTHFLFLARGTNYPVALEGALKLKEVAYIPCDGLSASEMKHGPIALVDEKIASVFIAPKDDIFSKTLSNIQEIKSRKGKIIAITTKNAKKDLEKIADHLIFVPETNKFLMPLLCVVPLQLFAYHLAVLLNRNVDKPRNLAKSVTVE